MNIGYARTSTVEQEASFEAQQAQLKAAGCEKVFCEQVSAVSPEREQLEAALDYVRDGDVLIVTKLDRLAPSVWPMSLARHRPSCELCILLCTASSDHGACLPSGAS
jgi:DNA invertase Pin-like site-specific DNA recombinase